jgi:chromosome segregation ATPase
MSRKHNRYLCWLIWLTLSFSATTVTAQSFEPILVSESLTQEIAIGSAELAQWQSLKQVEVQALDRNENVQAYFDTNFNVDGAYGELKTGETLTDWSVAAKSMGTTGFALAGAYALWRRRRQQYLERLRSGDSAAIEGLFEEHFSVPLGGEARHGFKAELNKVPATTDEWQAWATERGVPGGGATLGALYALWLKKRANQSTAQKLAAPNFNGYGQQLQSLWVKTEDKDQFEVQAERLVESDLTTKFETQLAAEFDEPLAPEKTEAVVAYQAAQSFLASYQAQAQALKTQLLANEQQQQRTQNQINATQKHLEQQQQNLSNLKAQAQALVIALDENQAAQTTQQTDFTTAQSFLQTYSQQPILQTFSRDKQAFDTQLNTLVRDFNTARHSQTQLQNQIRGAQNSITSNQRTIDSYENTIRNLKNTITQSNLQFNNSRYRYHSYYINRHQQTINSLNGSIALYEGYQNLFKQRIVDAKDRISQAQQDLNKIKPETTVLLETGHALATQYQQAVKTWQQSLNTKNSYQRSINYYDTLVAQFENYKKLYPQYAHHYQRTIDSYRQTQANLKNNLLRLDSQIADQQQTVQSVADKLQAFNIDGLQGHPHYDDLQHITQQADRWQVQLQSATTYYQLQTTQQEAQATINNHDKIVASLQTQATSLYNQQRQTHTNLTRVQTLVDQQQAALKSQQATFAALETEHQTLNQNTAQLEVDKTQHEQAQTEHQFVNATYETVLAEYEADKAEFDAHKQTLWQSYAQKITEAKTKVAAFAGLQQKQAQNEVFGTLFDEARHTNSYSKFYQAVMQTLNPLKLKDVAAATAEPAMNEQQNLEYTQISQQVSQAQVRLNELLYIRSVFPVASENQMKQWRDTGSYYFSRNYNGYTRNLAKAGWHGNMFGVGQALAQQQALVDQLKAQQQPYLDLIDARQNRINQVHADYGEWSSKMQTWWYDARQRVLDKNSWLQNTTNLQNVTQKALAEQNQKREAALIDQISLLTQSFSDEELNDLLSGGNEFEATAPTTTVTQLEQQISSTENTRNNIENFKTFRDKAYAAQGVWKSAIGHKYYKTVYNARYQRWQPQRVDTRYLDNAKIQADYQKIYDDQVFNLKQHIESTKQTEFKYQIASGDITSNVEAEFNHLQQFISTLQVHKNHTFALDAIATLGQIQAWQTELNQAKHDKQFKALTWAQSYDLDQRMTLLEGNLQKGFDKLIQYQQFFAAAPDTQATRSDVGSDASLLYFRDEYCCDEVYTFIEAQTKAKAFYQKYGQDISVLAGLKQSLAGQIEARKHLEGKSAYTDGPAYDDYVALKNDYQKVLKGEMPDVYMPGRGHYNSGYRTKRANAVPFRGDNQIHTWLGQAAWVFNNESKKSLLAQANAREALLAEQRGAAWEAQNNDNLADLFSEEQIARYEEIKSNVENAEQQFQALSEAEALVAQARQSVFTSNNQQATSTGYWQVNPNAEQKVLDNQAIQSLNTSDLQRINFTPEGSNTSLNLTLTDPQKNLLIQAYRSAYGNQSQFQSEAARMLLQQRANDRRIELAKYGIQEPVKTATIDSFLAENNPRTVADLNREIAEKEASKNEARALFTGAALTRALQNADDGIAALKKYRDNGPIAAAAYQTAMANFSSLNRDRLAAVDRQLDTQYEQLNKLLPNYFAQAKDLVAKRKAEIAANQYVPVRPEDNPLFEAAETLEQAQLREAQAALAQVQTQAKTTKVNAAPAIATNVAAASQEAVGESEFEAWITERTAMMASQEAQESGISDGNDFVSPAQYVDNQATKVLNNKSSSPLELGGAFFQGAKEQLVRELEGLKALLDWKTYWALLKAVPTLLGALWDMGSGVIKHGPDFVDQLSDSLAQAFGSDVEAIKANLKKVKDFAVAAYNNTADTQMAKGAGVGGVATMFAVVPVGKITKATDIAPLVNKFSGVVDDVLGKVASSGFKANSGVKLIDVALGATYTSFDGVASYIHKYGKLPDNYITKGQAEVAGWSPGKNVNYFTPGKSLGGDIFLNLPDRTTGIRPLPSKESRIWYEADINYTEGTRKNFSERILYSNDGLIYKSHNHYEDLPLTLIK